MSKKIGEYAIGLIRYVEENDIPFSMFILRDQDGRPKRLVTISRGESTVNELLAAIHSIEERLQDISTKNK